MMCQTLFIYEFLIVLKTVKKKIICFRNPNIYIFSLIFTLFERVSSQVL